MQRKAATYPLWFGFEKTSAMKSFLIRSFQTFDSWLDGLEAPLTGSKHVLPTSSKVCKGQPVDNCGINVQLFVDFNSRK